MNGNAEIGVRNGNPRTTEHQNNRRLEHPRIRNSEVEKMMSTFRLVTTNYELWTMDCFHHPDLFCPKAARGSF